MTLQLLEQALPRPSQPLEPGSAARWAEVEATLGLVLPTDYKLYIDTFGSGMIGDFILPLNPFSANEYINLLDYNEWRIDAYRKRKEKWGNDQCPYPLHPEPGGLLAWARTEDGDTLLWKTQGDPNTWSIIANGNRSTRFEEFAGPMTVFLHDLLRGTLQSQTLSTSSIKKALLFQPVSASDG